MSFLIFSRFFSFFLQDFFSKLQVILDFFTGYFHYLYSSFSLLLEVVFNITGCFQNCRQNSLFLQVVFTFTGFFSFFQRFFANFPQVFSIILLYMFIFFTSYFQYYRLVSKLHDFFYFSTVFFFQFSHRFFSLLLQVFFVNTCYFYQIHRSFSKVLQITFCFLPPNFNVTGLFRFFFTGFFPSFGRLFSI